jgi:hypothetical protein
MKKSKAQKKAVKSILNNNNVRRTANNKDVSFKKTSEINNKITLFKNNEKTIFNFLEGRTTNLSSELKDCAKIYFLFKLKNEQNPIRHKPNQDVIIKNNYLLYKKYLEKLT